MHGGKGKKERGRKGRIPIYLKDSEHPSTDMLFLVCLQTVVSAS